MRPNFGLTARRYPQIRPEISAPPLVESEIGTPADLHGLRADHAAYEDTESHQDHVRLVGHAIRITNVIGHAIDVRASSDQEQVIATVDLEARVHGKLDAVALHLAKEHSAGERLARLRRIRHDIGQRAAREVLACEDDLENLGRHAQHLLVFGFRSQRVQAVLDKDLMTPHHSQGIAGLEQGRVLHGHDLAVSSHGLNEDAVLAEHRFDVGNRLAREPILHLVGARRDGPVAREARDLFAAGHLLLVFLARLGDVELEQLRAQRRENVSSARSAENVRYGIRHGYVVDHRLLLVGCQVQAIDRVRCHAHDCGNRLGAGQQARCGAGVESGNLGANPRRDEAEHADDDREPDLRKAVAFQSPEKLRTHAIAQREEEHQEEDGLHRRGYRDSQLSHQHPYQEGPGNSPEAEGSDLDASHPISDAEGEEDCELRVLLEECSDDFHDTSESG